FAHHADWCFVITRTDFDAPAHAGISYILVPMDQPGVTYRPLRQMTGAGEFNEVFFDEARTPADMVVGEVNGGWKVAMTTLGVEREALLEHLAPQPRRAGHGHPRPRRPDRPTGGGRRVRPRRPAAVVHVQPVGDDLCRLFRDSEEHHRRARPRTAAGTQIKER